MGFMVDPSTPRGDGRAEGHPTGLKERKNSGKRKGEEGGEGDTERDLVQETSVVGQASLSGLLRQ
jgi:hypothetical protein